MPVRAANTRILIDQFDFSQQSKGLSLAIAGDALDANTLQATEHNSLPGWPEATLDLNGYFNGVGAGLLEQELQTRLGSDTPCVVSVILDTTAALPTPAYVMPTTWGSQLKIDAPVKELLMVNGQWTQPARRGLNIRKGTLTAIALGIVNDLGAVPGASAAAWAYLHVTAIAGTATNAVLTLQSATDSIFTTPVTHGTFTVSAVGAYLLTPSGTVNRYVRLNLTNMGGATSFTVYCILGISGITE